MKLSKQDAEELSKDIQKFVAQDRVLLDNPDTLSKLKSRLSGMLYFIGEAYTEAEIEVNKKWLNFKNSDVTVAEADRFTEASEEYRTMRQLKYKYKSIDRLITSIRDRLDVIENEKRRSSQG